MAARVVVFLDYQNVYMGAREAFHSHGAQPLDGQIDPQRLAELLVSKSPFDRELTEVRVYRGQPDSQKEPHGYAANARQCQAWQGLPRIRVITRTLQYPREWPKEKAREKGIDVKLAIDIVSMATRQDFDVGILMSCDTDLKPALEFVRDLRGTPYPRCEVAAWSMPQGYSRRLSIPGSQLWCHWLDEAAYRSVADSTNYALP